MGTERQPDVEAGEEMTGIEVQQVEISSLKPHPKNYKSHPEDQIEHICASIKAHGFYRNIVISNDGFILAGHGVVEAAKRLGMASVPVRALDIAHNDPRAMQVIIGDNEIAKLSMCDDRALTEMLKELNDFDGSALLGTGFDEKMIAGLLYITRPASEIADKDAAAHWVGMPEYVDGDNKPTLTISFESKELRKRFVEEKEIFVKQKSETQSWSACWPPTERVDLSSLKFE